jgi:hypothetical protein
MQNEVLTVQNVKDLQSGAKHWLEHVLGQRLDEGQQVFIMVFKPGEEPDEAARRRGIVLANSLMAQVEKNLAEHGVTDEEFDATVDEAMEHVRRREP